MGTQEWPKTWGGNLIEFSKNWDSLVELEELTSSWSCLHLVTKLKTHLHLILKALWVVPARKFFAWFKHLTATAPKAIANYRSRLKPIFSELQCFLAIYFCFRNTVYWLILVNSRGNPGSQGTLMVSTSYNIAFL